MAKKKVEIKKKVQAKTKKIAPVKKKAQPSKRKETKFTGEVTKIRQDKPATVIEWPRSITHVHTYGMLSPFFEGLRKGKLMATRCPNGRCPEKRLWIPPRGHCPDCHTEMNWKTLAQPGDRHDLRLYSGRLRRDRYRAFDALLADRCGDPRIGHDPQELSPLR